jgi:hypothetical protein
MQCTLHALSSKRASLAIAVSVGPAAGGGLRSGDYARYSPKTCAPLTCPLIGRDDSAVAHSVGLPTRPAWSPSTANQCSGLIVSTHACTMHSRTRQLLDHHCCSFEAERVLRRGGALGARVSAQRTNALQLRHHAVQVGATPLLPHHSSGRAKPASQSTINLELSSLLHVSQQHNFYFCGSSVPCDTTEYKQTKSNTDART